MNRMRAGFTIVEMMVVVAILAVLLGLVGTAATAAVRSAREKRADALAGAWRTAINSYYAQKGKWPAALEAKASSSNRKIETLSNGDADKVFREVLNETVKNNNALIDASIVYVCLKTGAQGCDDKHSDCTCPTMTEFNKAYASGKSVDSMAFGYPGVNKGKFRRFTVNYNTQTDMVSVSR